MELLVALISNPFSPEASFKRQIKRKFVFALHRLILVRNIPLNWIFELKY